MLRHESDTWILQRILRFEDCETWIILQRTLRYKDAETWIGDMDLAEDPEIHMDAYIRIRRHGSRRGSWDTCGCWDMNPETWILRYKDAETWMLRHESDTWILQRILRFEDVETWIRRHGLLYGSGDMDLAEDPEIHMDAETWIRRHGSRSGSWDTYGCLYTDLETWISQRSLRYIWMLIYGSGDMDLAEEPEIQRCWDMNPKTWIL